MKTQAKVIAHSTNGFDELATLEIEAPLIIWPQVLTHRTFSRNASSFRAVPVAKNLDQEIFIPSFWGENQAGMQASNEISDETKALAIEIYKNAYREAAGAAKALAELGVHKQTANRLLTPYSYVKAVITVNVDKLENFFNLRCHEDAQPEIKTLADAMSKALKFSKPKLLDYGEWHLPYITENEKHLSISDQLKISASCCAQVSYRALDMSLEKALDIYDKLVSAKPIHASPFEHQAAAIGPNVLMRNFVGFEQYRNRIEQGLQVFEPVNELQRLELLERHYENRLAVVSEQRREYINKKELNK